MNNNSLKNFHDDEEYEIITFLPFIGFIINLIVFFVIALESNYKNWTIILFIGIYVVVNLTFQIIPFFYYYLTAKNISCGCDSLWEDIRSCYDFIFFWFCPKSEEKNDVQLPLLREEEKKETIPIENDQKIILLNDDNDKEKENNE